MAGGGTDRTRDDARNAADHGAGMLPRPLAVVGAALLALGLATPVVAVVLLAGDPAWRWPARIRA